MRAGRQWRESIVGGHAVGQLWMLIAIAVAACGCREKHVAEPPAAVAKGTEISTSVDTQSQRGLGPWSGDNLALEIRSEGLRWRFHYYGPDGTANTQDDLCTGPDLYVPAGSVVEGRITSDKYICTWSVPELGVRRTAVPGLLLPCTFRVANVGRFVTEQDASCGFGWLFEENRGSVVVLSREKFVNWYERQWARHKTSKQPAD